MKKVQIKFRFFYSNKNTSDGVMCAAFIGEGITKNAAISDCWQKMAKDMFDRNLILSVYQIKSEITTL